MTTTNSTGPKPGPGQDPVTPSVDAQFDAITADIVRPTLPTRAPLIALVASLALGAGIAVLLGGGIVATVALALVVFNIGLPVWSLSVEGRRTAVDRVATSLMWTGFVIAVIPLGSLVYAVVTNGVGVLSAEFFTYDMRNVIGEGGGIYHALIGTLLMTLGATVISVPIGIMAAIYLVEYGKGSRAAKITTFLVDVMTGIPSIVAGLFAFALFAIFFGPGIRFGFGGSVALSLLMIPIVVRATEEMLKLVPDELREASYALGVPKWRTILKVVLPTAIGGIITGVTLAVARVAGETAPLLIIAGSTDFTNFNLFSDRMMALPLYIYYQYTQPGIPPEFARERAWGAALVLIAIVMLLNLTARLAGRYFGAKSIKK